MSSKLKVFLTHSFAFSDKDFIERFLAFIGQRKFHLEVKTAQPPAPRPFGEKIEDLVDWADVTFGLFTRRYKDPDTGKWQPPPFVLSECSFALGRYRDVVRKGVHGFVEEGIKHEDLGLPTAVGEEFPFFRREDFENGNTEPLERYLLALPSTYLGSLKGGPRSPYTQKSLRKTVEVYRNGYGLVKNLTQFIIQDARQFKANGNGVIHEIWVANRTAKLPPLDEMARTSMTRRREVPVFSCAFVSRGGKKMEQPMKVELVEQTEFSLKFKAIIPFPVKDNDSLTYHYIWGMPKMFRRFEEEMQSESDYDEVAIRTLHGRIGQAELRVKFERETVNGFSASLFSKEPFVRFSLTQEEDGLLMEPEDVDRMETDATFETYERAVPKLEKAMVIRWRPVSEATMTSELASSRFQKIEPVSEKSAGVSKNKGSVADHEIKEEKKAK